MGDFNINDTVYIIGLNENTIKHGGAINPRNYRVLEVKIISLYKDEIKIEMIENGRRQRVKNGQYFKHEFEAQQYCYKVANDMWRNQCAEKFNFLHLSNFYLIFPQDLLAIL